MTVGFATIEEAWGSIDPKPSKQQGPQRPQQGPQQQGPQQKKKQYRQFPIPKDPICELADMYSTKLSDDYSDTDLARQSQEYQKSTYQRNMNNRNITSDPLFEKQFDMQLPKLYDDIDDIDSRYNNAISAAIQRVKSEDNETVVEEPKVRQDIPKPVKYDFNDDEEVDDVPYTKTKTNSSKVMNPINSVNYIDLILYIISGIILIFLLDQFVRIGCNLRSK